MDHSHGSTITLEGERSSAVQLRLGSSRATKIQLDDHDVGYSSFTRDGADGRGSGALSGFLIMGVSFGLVELREGRVGSDRADRLY
jgi:hypothetical protein